MAVVFSALLGAAGIYAAMRFFSPPHEVQGD
jgi:hypothetical protein